MIQINCDIEFILIKRERIKRMPIMLYELTNNQQPE